MSDSTFSIVMGLVLFGIGLFYIVRNEATVGLRGFTRSLRGTGSLVVGGIYCIAGLILLVNLAFSFADYTTIQFGSILLILGATIIGYFFAESS